MNKLKILGCYLDFHVSLDDHQTTVYIYTHTSTYISICIYTHLPGTVRKILLDYGTHFKQQFSFNSWTNLPTEVQGQFERLWNYFTYFLLIYLMRSPILPELMLKLLAMVFMTHGHRYHSN